MRPAAPDGVNTVKPHGTGNALLAAAAHPALHGNEERYVNGQEVGTADDLLCHMFRHRDAPACDKGDLVPHSLLHEVKVDLLHPFFYEERLIGLFKAVFVGNKMYGLGPFCGEPEDILR